MDVLEIAAKALAGGVLVSLFALFAQTLTPKRFAGILSAAPSVALAGLLVTVGFKGSSDVRRSCVGMVLGAIAFVLYAAIAPATMRRFGVLRGSVAAIVAWVAVAFAPVSLATTAAAKTAAATSAGRSRRSGGPRRSGRPLRSGRPRPRIALDLGKLQDTKRTDVAIRFLFGAAVSLAAAIVSANAGPVIGGPLLASPAILLASLTLIADDEGRSAARDDARGAVAGALGLIAFAVTGAALFDHAGAAISFVLVTAAWAAVALGTYGVAWLAGIGADEPG